jgi:hypothetical protein
MPRKKSAMEWWSNGVMVRYRRPASDKAEPQIALLKIAGYKPLQGYTRVYKAKPVFFEKS